MIKLSEQLRDIAVLICAPPGSRLAEMDSYLKEKGIHVLLKPFDSDELLTAVTETLNDPHARSGGRTSPSKDGRTSAARLAVGNRLLRVGSSNPLSLLCLVKK